MSKFVCCFAVLVATASVGANAVVAPPRPLPSEPVLELDLHLELDAGSGAAELVLALDSSVPLSSITLFDPDGHAVLGSQTVASTRVGLQELELELASDFLPDLLARFPEGRYLVRATSALSAPIVEEVPFDHALPGRFRLIEPADGEMRAERAELSWTPSPNARRYALEIEQPDGDFTMEVVLPASSTSFRVPAGVLVPGATYELSLTAQGDTDNETEIEHVLRVAR